MGKIKKIKTDSIVFRIAVLTVLWLVVSGVALLTNGHIAGNASSLSSAQSNGELIKAEKSFKNDSITNYLWTFARKSNVNNQDLKFTILENKDTDSYKFHLKGSDGHTIAVAYLAEVQPKGDNDYIYAASIVGSSNSNSLTQPEKMESGTLQGRSTEMYLIFNNDDTLNMNAIDNQFNVGKSGSFIMHIN